MILIVGLGNPGRKFQKTRHNIGFIILESLQKKKNFSEWKEKKSLFSLISEGRIEDKKIILVKPQTFMNNSGKAVKKIIRNWKAALRGVRFASREIGNLFVIHDDIDLPLGTIKISWGRGAAGHKGVESIIKSLKTKNFVRFRIGIRPINAKQLTNSKIETERFVLQKFKKSEEKISKEAQKKFMEAITLSLEKGIEKAMNKYNQ